MGLLLVNAFLSFFLFFCNFFLPFFYLYDFFSCLSEGFNLEGWRSFPFFLLLRATLLRSPFLCNPFLWASLLSSSSGLALRVPLRVLRHPDPIACPARRSAPIVFPLFVSPAVACSHSSSPFPLFPQGAKLKGPSPSLAFPLPLFLALVI